MDRVADRIEREAEQAKDHGRLMRTLPDGTRQYLSLDGSTITIVPPSAPTLRVSVPGVDLAALC